MFLGIDAYQTVVECVITPTPTEWTKINKKPRRTYDLTAMFQLLDRTDSITFACIERQGPHPHDGTSAAFRTGYGYAAWLMALTAHRIPYTVMQTRQWRSILSIPPTPGLAGKRAVRTVVQARLPDAHITLDTADAVALALVATVQRPAIAS